VRSKIRQATKLRRTPLDEAVVEFQVRGHAPHADRSRADKNRERDPPLGAVEAYLPREGVQLVASVRKVCPQAEPWRSSSNRNAFNP
jgi:hypothetical protein